MYVAELDRPWLDSPFLFQGFSIESPDQLAALQGVLRIRVHDEAPGNGSAGGADWGRDRQT